VPGDGRLGVHDGDLDARSTGEHLPRGGQPDDAAADHHDVDAGVGASLGWSVAHEKASCLSVTPRCGSSRPVIEIFT
jgi:hypothetical protein